MTHDQSCEPRPGWVDGWVEIAKAVSCGLSDLRADYDSLRKLLKEDPQALYAASRKVPTAWVHLYRLPSRVSYWISLALFCVSCPAAIAIFTPRGLGAAIRAMSRKQAIELPSLLGHVPVGIAMFCFGPLMGHLKAALAGETLSSLLAEVEKGDAKAMILALRIEPSLVLIPPVSRVLALAALSRDEATLTKFGTAFNSPLGYADKAFDEMRLVIMLMVLTDQARFLNRTNAYAIFAEGAGLYTPEKSEKRFNDPSLALWANVRNWLKEAEKNPLRIFSAR